MNDSLTSFPIQMDQYGRITLSDKKILNSITGATLAYTLGVDSNSACYDNAACGNSGCANEGC